MPFSFARRNKACAHVDVIFHGFDFGHMVNRLHPDHVTARHSCPCQNGQSGIRFSQQGSHFACKDGRKNAYLRAERRLRRALTQGRRKGCHHAPRAAFKLAKQIAIGIGERALQRRRRPVRGHHIRPDSIPNGHAHRAADKAFPCQPDPFSDKLITHPGAVWQGNDIAKNTQPFGGRSTAQLFVNALDRLTGSNEGKLQRAANRQHRGIFIGGNFLRLIGDHDDWSFQLSQLPICPVFEFGKYPCLD